MSSTAARQIVTEHPLEKPRAKKKRLKKRVVPKPDGRYLIYYERP